MSGSLAKKLAEHLDSLILGPPTFDDLGDLPNMVVYPLFPSSLSPEPPKIITLSEGLRYGLRLSDTGQVDKAHVDNPLGTTILAGESDLLLGATQLRSMQFSCLIRPNNRTSVPVSCVEEGRPTERQAPFERTDSSPWSLRSYKIEQMAHHGEPIQLKVWKKVNSYLERAGASSKTKSIHAVYQHFATELDNLSCLFPRTSGQTGAICAVGSNLYAEFFSDPELLEDRYDHFLRSALVEALVHPGNEVVGPERIATFFKEIVKVSINNRVLHSNGLQNGGRTLVFSGSGISASALVDDSRLIHLCAHLKCPGNASSFAGQLGDLHRQRSAWKNNRAPLAAQLEKTCNKRRKLYNDFKTKLAHSPPPQRQNGFSESRDEKGAPKGPSAHLPKPLNTNVHEFFLTLFRSS
ncbi:MAG: hypothetical protein CME16_03895 [Gemmatimonadetes bacterium]|nr:hypothetical protein [Gemmatimonadota bacterium]